jgi:hypothetical protein
VAVKRISVFVLLLALLVVPQYLASQSMQKQKDDPGRLSPASLDIDACGCPTVFGPPVCEERTSWSLQKTANNGNLTDPDNTPYSFTISVIEGPTTKELRGTGELNIINSGEVTTYLSSVALLLEDKKDTPGPGNAPGPSGKNWNVLSVATDLKEQNDRDGVAQTCYGPITPTAGSNLLVMDPYDAMARLADIPIPPTIDNDGDGLRDEDPALPADPALRTGACAVIDNDGDGLYDEDPIDFEWIDTDGDGVPDTEVGIDNDGDGLVNEDDPDDDGDGLVDEDGACEDAVKLTFEYSLNIAGLNLPPGDGVVPSPDDLRLDMVVTFIAGGKRGGTCRVDADCDENLTREEEYVRSIQQRHQFDMPACDKVCDCVDLTDGGATVDDPSCVSLTSNALNEHICATGVAGTTTDFTVGGTVSCLGGECQTIVRNTATLSCEDPSLITGSPASDAFAVGCTDVPPPQGDYCTQTQGGWGSVPAGNNPGTCLYQWWWQVGNPSNLNPFGFGVFIGDLAGFWAWWLIPESITLYLPAGGPPGTLDGIYFMPQSTPAGVFGGQLTAATISLQFSDYNAANNGTLTCGDRTFPAGLGDLVYASCVDPYFIGRTVREVIEESNKVIGGTLPPAVPLSAYSDALAALNESYVDCNDQMLHCFTDPNAQYATDPGQPGDEPEIQLTPSQTPAETKLLQNTPNPFNPTTTIHFALAERSLVEVTVYDVRGRMVQRLLNEEMPAGVHSVGWNGQTINGAPAASGVYFYRMRAGSFVETRRMVLLK